MPDGAKFAIIALSGTQYKVTKDDVVVSNLLHGYGVGDTVTVPDVSPSSPPRRPSPPLHLGCLGRLILLLVGSGRSIGREGRQCRGGKNSRACGLMFVAGAAAW